MTESEVNFFYILNLSIPTVVFPHLLQSCLPIFFTMIKPLIEIAPK